MNIMYPIGACSCTGSPVLTVDGAGQSLKRDDEGMGWDGGMAEGSVLV